MRYIHNLIFYSKDQKIDQGAILLDDGRIITVGEAEKLPCPEGVQRLDGQGLLLSPGFIDLQINGAFGKDFTSYPQSIWEVGAGLPQWGVTSFLPTIVTSDLSTAAAAQQVILDGPPPGYRGAFPVGLHLEGPFLNPKKKGAHNPAYLRSPSLQDIQTWRPENGVRLVTLAPELPGALELIEALHSWGVTVSAGHSTASYEQAKNGIKAGISYGTHLFNAMPSLDHREPGLAAALLENEEAAVGIIADGVHVHPALVNLVWKLKKGRGFNLVTDAMEALGMPPGQYGLGDFQVRVDENSARLSDGTLAGSILSLDQAVRNLVAFCQCSLEQALRTVTSTPADVIGLERKGRILSGWDADLVLMDEDGTVRGVISRGEILREWTDS
jgi:N-acetylglucosamine-6-phosphate deacetylase